MQSTATTTTETTCSRCGGTSFGVFAGPSGRKRRCRTCAQPAPLDSMTADDIFARIARNEAERARWGL